jgi:hypothetical protein
MSKNLIVSFSGGETSAFMAQWIKNHWEDKYDDISYVFANTGLENEQTLEFVQRCDEYFKLNIAWVEANVIHEYRKGTDYVSVDFETASRNGEPFEQVIKKYGIPNQATPHCTRELKQAPLTKYAKNIYGKKGFNTAIGIRYDEIDRINEKHKELRFVYPLISDIKTTKQHINFYWSQMPFRLELKGYQGNCVTCWKKSDKKLFQLYKENPLAFNFMDKMEHKYPIDPLGHYKTFFRNNRSTQDMIELAKKWNGSVNDDSKDINFQFEMNLDESENCEVFSNCGDI